MALSDQPSNPDPRPTRDRILDAAEELFAAHGLAGTAVRDIATKTGLNPGSLYNHFAGKEALYEAVLERGVRPLIDVLRATAADSSSGSELADRALTAIMAQLEKTPHIPRLIQHETVSGGAHLAHLARLWIRPLVEEALVAAELTPQAAIWQNDGPRLVAAWMNLIFGYFSMAPLFSEVFDEDPLSAEGLAQQTEFLRRVASVMFLTAPGSEGQGS